MKSKFLLTLLALICAICCTLGFAACFNSGNGKDDDKDSGGEKNGLSFTLNSDKSAYVVSGIGTVTDTDVTIPSTYNNLPVTGIGYAAFSRCSSMTSVVIPDSVTEIDVSAFSRCSSLKNVTVPGSVVKVGSGAFSDCTSLTTVTLGEGVSEIEYSTFMNCNSLTDISIPDSLTYIGNSVFRDCTSLKYNEYDNALYLGNADNPYLILTGAKDKKITSCNINQNTKFIYEHAFGDCSKITKITIPNKVISICQNAFGSCSKLNEVIMPVTVTSIGKNAFVNCYDLAIIKYQGTEAQWNAIEKGEDWTYGNTILGVTYNYNIGDSQNGNDNTDDNKTTEGLDMASSLDNKSYVVVGLGDTTSGDVVIPSTYNSLPVTSIAQSAFAKCATIKSITIPESVVTIGPSAFTGCTSLTSVTLNSKGTKLQNAAFKDCTALTEVTLGKNISTIGNYVFQGCTSLTGITIPDSVTQLGEGIFRDCTKLNSIILPNSLTKIGDFAFKDCVSLNAVTIPEKITSISNSMFEGCSALSEVSIPVSVKSIGNYAFDHCSSLTTLNFKGTQSQWQAISKGSGWNDVTGKYTVICSNGNLKK